MKNSLMRLFKAILRRDLKLAFRLRADYMNPLLFFIIVVSLFPLAVSPDVKLLQNLGPGVIWVAALLASLLSLDSLFRSDFEDGSIEQWLISPQSLSVIVLARVVAHWLVSGLPLVLIAPLLGVWLNLSSSSIEVLITTLLLGTPVLSLIGSIGMALTVGLRGGGMLLALLVLPLYIPVLIFGTSAVIAVGMGVPINAQLAILGALLALALSLAPLATAAALRIGVV